MPDSNRDDGMANSSKVSRRKALAAGALGVTGMLAGCASTDDSSTNPATTSPDTSGSTDTSGDTESPTSTGGTAIEKVYDLPGRSDGVPTELQFNYHNPKQAAPHVFTWDQMAIPHFGLDDGLFYPGLAKSWEYDSKENTFTINLREDTTWWHNGKQVTSEDVWATLMLEWTGRVMLSKNTESIETPDSKTVVLNMKGSVNQTLLEQQIITRRVLPSSHYMEWAKDLAKLRGDKKAFDEYFAKNIVTTEFTKPIGDGPFKITEATRQGFKTEVHDGHWAMDPWVEAESEGCWFDYTGKQRWTQMAYADELDAFFAGLIPDSSKGKLPDHFEKFTKPATWGYAVGVNHNIEPLGDRHVRMALMYVIDRKEVTMSATSGNPDAKIIPEIITGISATQDLYIPEEMHDQYLKYRVDHDKATTLLKEAGLTKEGGKWRLPDGSKWSLTITTMAGNTEMVKAQNTVASQLRRFGIDAQLETVPNSQFWGQLWPNNDFELFTTYWGGWRPYPLNGFRLSLYDMRYDNIGYPAKDENGGKIKVSMPIGDFKGKRETVDVEGLFFELSGSPSEKRNQQIFQTLAWVYNQTLPELPLFYNKGGSFVATDGWDIPGPDSKHRHIDAPATSLPRTGLMTPKTE